MVMYRFQCFSLKSSHSLLPPLCLKVCSLCLCLLCFPAIRIISTIFLDSIYMHLYTIFVFLWLISLCIIGSRFIHLIRNDSNAFLFIAELYSIAHIYHIFFIHSSVDGHWGCFYVLVIANSSVMNTGVQMPFSVMVSWGVYSKLVELLGHMVVLFLLL